MQPVVGGRREELGGAGGDRCTEQRRAGDAEGRIGMGHGVGERCTRRVRLDLLAWDDGNRRRRGLVGDPRHVAVPREADAARQRRGEVVRMSLEIEPEGEQLVWRGVAARGEGPRDEAQRDRRGARAEAARAGNALHVLEAAAFG